MLALTACGSIDIPTSPGGNCQPGCISGTPKACIDGKEELLEECEADEECAPETGQCIPKQAPESDATEPTPDTTEPTPDTTGPTDDATPCTPDCAAKQCGDDGCGGDCGTCEAEFPTCTEDGQCVTACVPDCEGKTCGDDGCDGECGECSANDSCVNGQCVTTACAPDCEGKTCGDDGCDGECGECSAGDDCVEGQCVTACVPDCTDKNCGDDGCGSECGECAGDDTCEDGQCVPTPPGCMDVITCSQACDATDLECGEACIAGVSNETVLLSNSYAQCTQGCAGEDSSDAEKAFCNYGACATDFMTCVTDDSFGSGDCEALQGCLSGCSDSTCVQACYSGSTLNALLAYSTSFACILEACLDADDTEHQSCMNDVIAQGLCIAEMAAYEACEAPEPVSPSLYCFELLGTSCDQEPDPQACSAALFEAADEAEAGYFDAAQSCCGGGACESSEAIMANCGSEWFDCFTGGVSIGTGTAGCGASHDCLTACGPATPESQPNDCLRACYAQMASAEVLFATLALSACEQDGTTDCAVETVACQETGPCTPSCADDNACGDDGCGESCGTCAATNQECSDGTCVCVPACDGAVCGDDGCGGVCGVCADDSSCQGVDCILDCTPLESCGQVLCGVISDGCGGYLECGGCADNEGCTSEGLCACIADCDGKVCGGNGCGGSCGTCANDGACTAGQCPACEPACPADNACGPDGCGGSCGTCIQEMTCNASQLCECTPTSSTMCMGSSSWTVDSCGNPLAIAMECNFGCDGGVCTNCTPSCTLNQECGSDGCGGTCGTCTGGEICQPGNECACSSTPNYGFVCGPFPGQLWYADSCGDALDFALDCPYGCEDGECLPCQPTCDGPNGGGYCGGDGCGGQCTCEGGEYCGPTSSCGTCWVDAHCPSGDVCALVFGGGSNFCAECTHDSDCKGSNQACMSNVCSSLEPPTILINELDYDNTDADGLEYVELYNHGNSSVSPAQLTNVYLYIIAVGLNGGFGQNYSVSNTIPLAALLTENLAPGGYALLGTSALLGGLNVTIQSLPIAHDTLPNGFLGSGAAVALVIGAFDSESHTVIDSVHYEQSIPSVEGFSIWAAEGSPTATDTGDSSLSRCPNGGDTNNNANDFQLTSSKTPGLANSCTTTPPNPVDTKD
jgi:hypothetical protein